VLDDVANKLWQALGSGGGQQHGGAQRPLLVHFGKGPDMLLHTSSHAV
jgi:hypothetical protein